MHPILIALLTGLFALPSFATIVFSNLNGVNCQCGESNNAYYGQEFPVTGANYQLTDVKAYIANLFDPATTLDFYIYSDASGVPGTELTELIGTVPSGQSALYEGVVTSGAPLTPVTLNAGTNYWLVIHIPDSGIVWLAEGSSNLNFVEGSPGAWTQEGTGNLQFEIDGTTTTPEPGTLTLVGSAMALAFAALRRRS